MLRHDHVFSVTENWITFTPAAGDRIGQIPFLELDVSDIYHEVIGQLGGMTYS